MNLSEKSFTSFDTPFPSFPITVTAPCEKSTVVISSAAESGTVDNTGKPFSLAFCSTGKTDGTLMTGSLKSAPIDALRALGLYISQPPPTISASTPSASAVRDIAPRLSGF